MLGNNNCLKTIKVQGKYWEITRKVIEMYHETNEQQIVSIKLWKVQESYVKVLAKIKEITVKIL